MALLVSSCGGSSGDKVMKFCNEQGYDEWASNPSWHEWNCGDGESSFWQYPPDRVMCYSYAMIEENRTYFDDGGYIINNEEEVGKAVRNKQVGKYRCYERGW